MTALDRARGDVLVCAADMPLVDADACRTILAAAGTSPRAACVLACTQGRLQPLLGVYRLAAVDALRAAPPDAPLTAMVEALGPHRVDVPERVGLSVDTPEEVEAAERLVRP